MDDVKAMCEKNMIKIGTTVYVTPVPPLNKIYEHVGLVINVKDDGVEVFHLKKNFFVKHVENVFIKFESDNNIFDFKNGVKFILSEPLTKKQLQDMHCRVKELLLLKNVPYGLNLKDSFNCESLVSYVITGEKTTASQVLNFKNKFGIIGSVAVSTFDIVMKITNRIGFIICYFKSNKENK